MVETACDWPLGGSCAICPLDQKGHNIYPFQSGLWCILLVTFLGGQQHSRTLGKRFSASFGGCKANWQDTVPMVSATIGVS